MKGKTGRQDKIRIAAICACLAVMLLLELLPVRIVKEQAALRLVWYSIPSLVGAAAVVLLAKLLGLHLFHPPVGWLWLIPCVVIAVDNFQFAAYFAGKMQLVHTGIGDFLAFLLYCISVGLMEELVFRGIFFSLLLKRFEKTKKGFWKALILSSVVFALAHLFNLFSGASVPATILQVGYSVLTGGLFAFAFFKSGNVLISAGVHALYNFCGLLFTSSLGLGAGAVIDLPTAITMAIVCTIAGAFIVCKLCRVSEQERLGFYQKIGIEAENKA